MAFLILAILVGLFVWATQLGLIPPAHATTIIQIRSGVIRVTRGRLKPHAKEHVTDILTDAKVTRGFIAIVPGRRVMFSHHIPKTIRQQLRNVLLNQWA